MVIKTYSVTLNEDTVNKAKTLIKNFGGKLSPLINSFLENWIKEQENKIEENNNGDA